jgi:hypothetical protein
MQRAPNGVRVVFWRAAMYAAMRVALHVALRVLYAFFYTLRFALLYAALRKARKGVQQYSARSRHHHNQCAGKRSGKSVNMTCVGVHGCFLSYQAINSTANKLCGRIPRFP